MAKSMKDAMREIQKGSKAPNNQRKTGLTKETFDWLFANTVNRLMQDAGNFETEYQENDIIRTVKNYYRQVPDFVQGKAVLNKPSLNKGLLIYGPYGVGKSLLINTIQKMGFDLWTGEHFRALWFSARTAPWFVEQYMDAASDGQGQSTFELENYYRGKLYIDDLGMEKKVFGRDELLADILFHRHLNKAITYVTTNLTPKEIAERYGGRLGDRIPEMFNIIKWEGPSLREE